MSSHPPACNHRVLAGNYPWIASNWPPFVSWGCTHGLSVVRFTFLSGMNLIFWTCVEPSRRHPNKPIVLSGAAIFLEMSISVAPSSISYIAWSFAKMAVPPQKLESSSSEKAESISELPHEASSTRHSTASSTANATKLVAGAQHDTTTAPSPRKPSVLKRIWTKLDFNALTVMFMVKGALPPTICMAMYQSQRVAVHYLNLGYLMIIISILTVPVLPRGKFLMNLFISLVSPFRKPDTQKCYIEVFPTN